MYVCVCEYIYIAPNSGTPGANLTKLDTRERGEGVRNV